MIREKVYLDTTIPSAYFDDRTPERQEFTQSFWENRLPDFEIYISEVVLNEIKETSDQAKQAEMKKLVENLKVLFLDQEADALAKEYINRGVFPDKVLTDANHLAIAVVNRIGYFISWNFRHLVKVRTRRGVNLVNALLGYGPIEIISPPEL